MKENKIDFVIPWVDGNDEEWRSEYNQYANDLLGVDASMTRYRDWDCLRYWFRGVEKYANWVNRIHLVTNGQLPKWLNKENPRLNIVKHSDYINDKFLPVFSANPIEMNLHRIEALEEYFVYFNDDFFIINHVKPERFFRNGLPCDMAICNTIQSDKVMGHITLNDIDAINDNFNKRQCIRRNLSKWFCPSYGAYILRTLALLPWPRFSGFVDQHLAQPFRKETFREIWETCPKLLEDTTSHKFRNVLDVNMWFARYWALVKGEFAPINVYKDSVYFQLDDDNFDDATETVRKQKKSIVVLNDSDNISSFELKKTRLVATFESILPDKCSFEL